MNTLEEKKDIVKRDRYRGVKGNTSKLSNVQIDELSFTLTNRMPSKSIMSFMNDIKRHTFITMK
jgi:hypothetical protein